MKKKCESVSQSVVFNSLQPHGLQPTRLLYAWDSPDLPDPGIKPGSPALQEDSLPSELPDYTYAYPYVFPY